MNKTQVVRLVTTATIDIGISYIVGSIVRSNVPMETRYQKIAVRAGTMGLTSLVCRLSDENVNRIIDKFVEDFNTKKKLLEDQDG